MEPNLNVQEVREDASRYASDRRLRDVGENGGTELGEGSREDTGEAV